MEQFDVFCVTLDLILSYSSQSRLQGDGFQLEDGMNGLEKIRASAEFSPGYDVCPLNNHALERLMDGDGL